MNNNDNLNHNTLLLELREWTKRDSFDTLRLYGVLLIAAQYPEWTSIDAEGIISIQLPQKHPLKTNMETELLPLLNQKCAEFGASVREIIQTLQNEKSNFCEMLDEAICNFSDGRLGLVVGRHGQPKLFSQLINGLLRNNAQTIFNPFSGMMSYATALSGYEHFVGMEVCPQVWQIGLMRITLADVWNKVDSRFESVEIWPDEKFDAIVCTPEYGLKLKMSDTLERESIESVSIRRFCESTTDRGVLVTFIPAGYNYSVSSQKMRVDIVQNNWLDTVIHLPQGVFPNTSIAVSIWVLRKRRNDSDPVRIINVSDYGNKSEQDFNLMYDEIIRLLNTNEDTDRCQMLSRKQLEMNDFDFRCLNLKKDQDEHLNEGYEYKSLQDLLSPYRTIRKFDETEGHLFRFRDLLPKADFHYTAEDFNIETDLSRCFKIVDPVLVLTAAGEAKAVFCDASENHPFFVKSGAIILKCDEQLVLPEYMCLMVKKWGYPLFGSSQIHRTWQQIKNNQFAICPLPQQAEVCKIRRIELKTKDELTEELVKLRKDYADDLNLFKQDIRNRFVELNSMVALMDYYRQKIGRETDAEKQLENKQNALKTKLGELRDCILNYNLPEDFGLAEQMELDKLTKCLRQFEKKTDLYSIVVERNDDTHLAYPVGDTDLVSVYLAKSDIVSLANQIIENAIQHGFKDVTKKYTLTIRITCNVSSGCLCIDFINDGEPMPADVTKEVYGQSIKKFGTKVSGGYIVKQIVRHYGGDYYLNNTPEKTCISIHFPISKTE